VKDQDETQEHVMEQDQTSAAEPELVVPKKARRKKVSGVLKRLTKYEIMERRQHIGKLRTQGLQVRQIAKILNLSDFTVEMDLHAVQKENAQLVSQFEKDKHLGDSLARYEHLRQEAWSRYYSAKEDRHKLKALEVLLSIEKEQNGMLIDTGVIVTKEPPQQVEHKHTLQLDWSADMKNRVAEALLQQSLRSTLAEPTLEALPPVQDAELVNVTETSTDGTEEQE
jgi:hypothetical protein